MAWVAVNKDGAEFIYDEKPTRGKNDWEPAIIGQMPSANDWGGGGKIMTIYMTTMLDFQKGTSRN